MNKSILILALIVSFSAFATADKVKKYASEVSAQSYPDVPNLKPIIAVDGQVPGTYQRDDKNIYFKKSLLPNADVYTFQVLFGSYYKSKPFPTSEGDSYAFDKNYYFLNNGILAKRNDPEYRVLAKNCLLAQNTLRCGFGNAHDNSQAIQVQNPKKLSYLGSGYFQDDQNIYSLSTEPVGIVKGYKPGDIKIFPSNWIETYYIQRKDKISLITIDGEGGGTSNSLNHLDLPLKNIDILSFEVIKYPYAKDKNHVYYDSTILSEANPKTFNANFQKNPKALLKDMDEEGYAYAYNQYVADDKHVYFEGEILKSVSPLGFKVFYTDCSLPKFLGIYKKKVFYFGQLLDGIDSTKMKMNKECTIIQDDNTKWYKTGNCEEIYYVPESQIGDPSKYSPPC